MSSRILVVYYTRTGTTKTVAEQVAAALGGDLERIVDHTNRSGILGFLRSGYEAIRHRVIRIEPAIHDPSTYDLVIVGTPVWTSSPSSPVRTYLMRHRGELHNVAWFCSMGGSGDAKAFAQMTEISGTAPLATLGVRQRDISQSAEQIARFAADAAMAVVGEQPPTPSAITGAASAKRPPELR